MSDSDLEEPPNNGWFNSESDLPGISSVDSNLAMGAIVSPPSANRHIWALDFGIAVQQAQPPIWDSGGSCTTGRNRIR